MSKKKTTPPVEPADPGFPFSFETFRYVSLGSHEMNRIKQDQPSSFNGWVRVEKYRITVEKVEEPIEVIHQRIQDLWDVCDNYHHWGPLLRTAKEFGYELVGGLGNKLKKQ